MTRADFYVLSGKTSPSRFSCSIANKAVSQGHSVYVLTSSRAEAEKMDDLLWTWQDISFLPHALADKVDANEPVLIGWQEITPPGFDVLINLTDAVPDWATFFKRIVEIVADEPSQRDSGRERYKYYRKLDVELFNHDIASEPAHGG